MAEAVMPMSSVLASVEQQLRDLWVPTSPSEPIRSRACTMNLVVVASSAAVAEHYTPIVDEVTQSIPSRSIVVTIDPTSRVAALRGDVTAVCGTDNAACSERVTLVATGAACARVASAALALIVPELPTTLVWLGRVHEADPIFREMAADAQRVIVDTEYTSIGSLLTLSRWAKHAGETAVADLAWTRIAVWQEMCARFFDDPQMRPLAHQVEGLRIVQMSSRGDRLGSEGSLLLGWIATRLGWRIEALAGAIELRRPDKGKVELELASMPRDPRVAPLAIASVTMRMGAATGTVARDFEGDVEDVLRYKLDVNLPCASEQTVRLGANKGARVLERTLRRPARDEAFDAAVAFAEQLADDALTVQ
jgi:glucose-6-phosphate dehydrogenase assembly protein OpcA